LSSELKKIHHSKTNRNLRHLRSFFSSTKMSSPLGVSMSMFNRIIYFNWFWITFNKNDWWKVITFSVWNLVLYTYRYWYVILHDWLHTKVMRLDSQAQTFCWFIGFELEIPNQKQDYREVLLLRFVVSCISECRIYNLKEF
jgi:hypothetical protein